MTSMFKCDFCGVPNDGIPTARFYGPGKSESYELCMQCYNMIISLRHEKLNEKKKRIDSIVYMN